MKLFRAKIEERAQRQPERSPLPELQFVRVGALYRGARTGGDFFEFLKIGPSRLLVLMLDIAGKREQALHIAASVQDTFRQLAPQMFTEEDLNEADAVTNMMLELNRAIISAAGGVRCSPGFFGCYNENLGILSYINAGHTPALLKDPAGVSTLEANGLPLGLFSHATHDSQMCALQDGAALMLVSRGLIEIRGGREEFGLDRAKKVLHQAAVHDPQKLCVTMLDEVKTFIENAPRFALSFKRGPSAANGDDVLGDNDVTTLAVVRNAAAKAARV